MKVMRMIGKVLIIIAIGLVVLGGVGYVFQKPLTNMALAKRPGNAEQYHPENVEENPDSLLKGKRIIFLGSSVTEGSASLGVSFVEYLEKIDGIIPAKEAVSGTTLVTGDASDSTSYIARMKTIDTDFQADAFICQLSTNDATQGKEFGTISDGFDLNEFDTETIAGAIEYVIAYAKQTWGCPVIFYTGTRYESEAYEKMVDLLLDIQEKWDIGVIDLWNDEEMNSVSKDDYQLYMVNGIHPSQAGYLVWWTPKFESYLMDYLA